MSAAKERHERYEGRHRGRWAWLPAVHALPVLWDPPPQVRPAFPPSHYTPHTPPWMSSSHTATSLPLCSSLSKRINIWKKKIYMYDFPPPCGPVSFICEKIRFSKISLLWKEGAHCDKEGNWGLPGAPHHVPSTWETEFTMQSSTCSSEQMSPQPPLLKNLERHIPGTDESSSWKHTQAEDLQMFNKTCKQPTKIPAQSWKGHTSSSAGNGSPVRETNRSHCCSRDACHRGCCGAQAHLSRIATFQSIAVWFWTSEFSLPHWKCSV